MLAALSMLTILSQGFIAILQAWTGNYLPIRVIGTILWRMGNTNNDKMQRKSFARERKGYEVTPIQVRVAQADKYTVAEWIDLR